MATEYRALIWRLMRNELVRKILCGRLLDQAGLQRGRFPMMEVLSHRQGCTQREIAELLHVSPASTAVSLRRMERDGLVRRGADESDQRCKRIYLTEKALQMDKVCREQIDALDRKMFVGFSPQELETMASLLDRAFQNVAGDEFKTLSPFTAFIYKNEEEKRSSEESDD